MTKSKNVVAYYGTLETIEISFYVVDVNLYRWGLKIDFFPIIIKRTSQFPFFHYLKINFEKCHAQNLDSNSCG